MTNAQILRDIMKDYGLTRQKTADLIEVPKTTLDSWLRSDNSKAFREMSARELTFLKLVLKNRKKKPC